MHRKQNNYETIWIYGKHSVKAALLNKKRKILKLIVLESNKKFLNELSDILQKNFLKIKIETAEKKFFSDLFGENAVHQGCAVLCENLNELILEDLIKDSSDNRPFIFLDQITDPQNIGSVLRAAAVFGARAVVVTKNHSTEITPSIAKTASGAIENIPLIRVVNLVQSINFLKKYGFWSVGLDERAKTKLYEIDLSGKFIFIIGNEGAGMRHLSRESCDFLTQLPSIETFTTLNAAQAATITLYESYKQRILKI